MGISILIHSKNIGPVVAPMTLSVHAQVDDLFEEGCDFSLWRGSIRTQRAFRKNEQGASRSTLWVSPGEAQGDGTSPLRRHV